MVNGPCTPLATGLKPSKHDPAAPEVINDFYNPLLTFDHPHLSGTYMYGNVMNLSLGLYLVKVRRGLTVFWGMMYIQDGERVYVQSGESCLLRAGEGVCSEGEREGVLIFHRVYF